MALYFIFVILWRVVFTFLFFPLEHMAARPGAGAAGGPRPLQRGPGCEAPCDDVDPLPFGLLSFF